MPNGTRRECRQTRAEPRLLPHRSDPQVHVVAQPRIRLDVPVSQIRTRVLRQLHAQRIDIRSPVPRNLARDRVDAVIPNARQDARALGHGPHAIVLHARGQIRRVHDPHALQETVLQIAVADQQPGVVRATARQEKQQVAESLGELPQCGGRAARDAALLARGRLPGGVDGRGHVEHACVEPAAVLGKVHSGPGEQRWEEEDPAGVVQEAWELGEHSVFLEVGELVIREGSVGDVPAKG